MPCVKCHCTCVCLYFDNTTQFKKKTLGVTTSSNWMKESFQMNENVFTGNSRYRKIMWITRKEWTRIFSLKYYNKMHCIEMIHFSCWKCYECKKGIFLNRNLEFSFARWRWKTFQLSLCLTMNHSTVELLSKNICYKRSTYNRITRRSFQPQTQNH